MATDPETNEERVKQDQEFTFLTLPTTSFLTKINGTNVRRLESWAFAAYECKENFTKGQPISIAEWTLDIWVLWSMGFFCDVKKVEDQVLKNSPHWTSGLKT